MEKIILVGAGGHANSCIDVIELEGKFKIAGLIEKSSPYSNKNYIYKIIGTDNDLPDLRKKYCNAFVTVGQIKSPELRLGLIDNLYSLGFNLPSIVSPRSHVSIYSHIGNGTIIMHDVIINANAKIGKNCIINTKCLIEHDVIIGDNCHIATGAIINGNSTVGNNCFVGSGTVINQSISIGDNSIIGSSLSIKKNIDSNRLIKADFE
mgnify:CR=1 FL=1